MNQIMILSLLWTGFSWTSKNSKRQMSFLIISLRSSISWSDAWNSSMTQRLSQHKRRRHVRTYKRRMHSNLGSPLSSLSKTQALQTGCQSTIGGVWRHTAEEGKAYKDNPFLCCNFNLLLCPALSAPLSQWQLSARDIDTTPMNMDTNVFTFISH